MKTLSLSEAKMKLSSLVDFVYRTDEEVIITKNGSPAAVLVSPDEFEGWKETVALPSRERELLVGFYLYFSEIPKLLELLNEIF